MTVTNGSLNSFTPRSQSAPFEKNMPVTTFIRDTFFGQVNTHPNDKIDMDFRKGGYIIAPFVAPKVGGINIDRRGFETRTYSPPRIAPERVINPEVLEPRMIGETIHTTMTPEDRQDYYLQQDAQELDDSITRREEVMCSQLISTGIISVRGYVDEKHTDYIDDNIDYQVAAANMVTLAGGDKWDQATSKKYENMESAAEVILKAGYDPRYGILGQGAWAKLRTDDAFIKLLDTRRMEMGMIAPQLRTQMGNGLKYVGTLPELGIDMFVYYAWYLDYDGVVKPIYPIDKFSILPENLGSMEYAAITQLEEDKRYHTYEGTRVPKIIANVNDDVMKYRLSSKPMPKPYDVAAWVTYDVL